MQSLVVYLQSKNSILDGPHEDVAICCDELEALAIWGLAQGSQHEHVRPTRYQIKYLWFGQSVLMFRIVCGIHSEYYSELEVSGFAETSPPNSLSPPA